MTPAARIATAAELLDEVLEGAAAEKVLTSWARRSRFAGSKDRAAVRDHVFDALRCLRSFAALGGAMTGRGLMIGMARSTETDPETIFTGEGHGAAALSDAERAAGQPPVSDAEAGDMPEWLWPHLTRALADEAAAVAEVLRHRAPVYIRVNTSLISADALARELAAEGILTTPGPLVATALEVTEGARRLASTIAFGEGRFEMQDAASQAICAAIPVQDGHSVLDYCAGGGGKTLALGARATLHLTAHDVAPERMRDLPVRARRAGIDVHLAERGELAGLAPFDVVLCDVPCSGSGAWRRAPEGKWRLTEDRLEQLLGIQAQILDEAASLVAAGGLLAYATCSLFEAENGDQIAAFLARNPGWQVETTRRLTPLDGGDGFFLACLRRI
ncbi:RsmB/NOP family class I SAM-dependent RNA methyltransferase [Pseudooceanicola sediminis]|uniref:RsmB/NOP family class I SAM-dependent RNA methyltransferase n=1 Tax=Pseudooceanicola sediminis TaxID=2211117 RepID=A0A399J5Q8_9RHOB|nr:RsmB/NOP family class I SAM-dependent RNA methyltransferase [Pseudooceanicola sediminis]KAA2316849.1 RsmB/NOP family class I SAM-dependent RNA methyltransferase [Puniceibacterium sp. HSS470]RII40694.1 RsmB/NOP family class I SAM-dependent RNA methyltransferase [Pseudooceanicola sediminis]|tara:strand:- start:160116 stop:161282 length:1167 start_codon:yes stop_codon:yes gene_type:complete